MYLRNPEHNNYRYSCLCYKTNSSRKNPGSSRSHALTLRPRAA